MPEYEPGLYPDIPFAEYVRIPAMNFSTLKAVEISPLHLKATIDGRKREETDPLKLGRIIHSAVLTPDLFDREVIVSDGCAAEITSKSSSNCGKPCEKSATWTADNSTFYCGTHKKSITGAKESENCITSVDYQSVIRIRDGIKTHPAADSLRLPGQPEVTIVFWRNGVLCKVRIDWYAQDLFVDLKKKGDSPLDDRSILRTIKKYGYHQQIAAYALAIESITNAMPERELLFCEDSEPFDVCSMPIDEQSLAIWIAEFDRMLARYKICKRDDHWPGFHEQSVSVETGKVRRGGLPKWARDEAVASGLVSEDSWPTEPLRGIELPPALTGFEQ